LFWLLELIHLLCLLQHLFIWVTKFKNTKANSTQTSLFHFHFHHFQLIGYSKIEINICQRSCLPAPKCQSASKIGIYIAPYSAPYHNAYGLLFLQKLTLSKDGNRVQTFRYSNSSCSTNKLIQMETLPKIITFNWITVTLH
jgi:hypothetical protein